MNLDQLPLPKIHQRPLLAWVTGAAVLLGLTAGTLFVGGMRKDEDETNYYIPEGYRKQVTAMAKAGAIRHSTTPAAERQILPPWGQLLFDESSASPRQATFFDESKRLQADLEQFNETGGGFFEVRLDGKIYITQHFHNFALPYPERPQWRGSFSLAGEKLPSLVAPSLYLGFAMQEDEAPTADQFKVLTLQGWSRPAQDQTHHRARAYELLGEDAPLLRFTLVGERVVMQLIDTSQCRVYLNGDIINQAGSEAVRKFIARREEIKDGAALPSNAAPLADGDRLRVQHLRSGVEMPLRFGRFAGGMVSRRWIEDGREINVVDPELATELPYFVQLQESLNRYAQAHPHPNQIGQPAVQLSIDRALHGGINRIFLDYVRNFDARRSAVRNIQLEPACVTVLNALTGDVLAMPSYPAPADLDNMRKRAQSGAMQGVTESKLRRLGINQNLTLIPIGSTTKPLLATAIWDKHPDLKRLVVQEPAGGRSELFGYKLAAPYGTVGPRKVDATAFLRVSSNDYTLHLGLLMLAKGVKISPAGTPVFPTGKADLSAYFRGDRIPGGLEQAAVGVFPKLAECFDVALVQQLADGPAAQWNAGPLESMFKQIGAEGTLLYDSFSPVLPEKANLHLDKVSSVRGSYTSMLLGSGTNYWSNLELAQAYARIGTGRKIRARITADPKQQVTLESFEPLPVKNDTLVQVHAGMQQCAEGASDSTAERIGDSIRAARAKFAKQGLQFYALAKTGTASRVPARKSGGRIIEDKRECAAFCLYLEVRDKSNAPLAALSTAVYLQDRAATRGGSSPRNSAVAVQLTEDFLPELITWLETQPGVRKVLAAAK